MATGFLSGCSSPYCGHIVLSDDTSLRDTNRDSPRIHVCKKNQLDILLLV